jgi:predicted secreted protein
VKLIMAVFLIFGIFLQMAGAQNQAGTSAVSQQAIGKESVWTPPAGTLEKIRDKCSSLQAPAFGECFVSGMKTEGASAQAMAFASRMGNLAYMTKFLETGRIDVAYVEHPFRANENYSWFLVNGTPDLVNVDDPAYRAKSGFEKDARYISLAKANPQLAWWPDDRTDKSMPMARSLKGQGQRFVISNRITDGCRACNYLGTAWFAFDFAQNGTFLGTKFLGIEKAPRQSTTMTQSDSVEQGLTNPKKPVEATAGQKFTIILGANHTTGYRWELSSGIDKNIVELVGSVYEASDTQKVGSGGREVWTFLAKSPGKIKVSFKYFRPWEKQAGPAKTTSIEIIVQ